MIYIIQLLCIIGAAMIVGILFTFNPIYSYIPSAIMSSVLVLFFGAGALSLKESLAKKGGVVPWSYKIIGTIILLAIYGFGARYFMANWKGEDLSAKKSGQVAAESMLTETGAAESSLTTDSLFSSATIADSAASESISPAAMEEPQLPATSLKAQFTLIWIIFVSIFLLWVMVKGGEDVKPGMAGKK